MIIDSEDLDETSAYKLLIGSIIPRPIAWVSTLSTEGSATSLRFRFSLASGASPRGSRCLSNLGRIG